MKIVIDFDPKTKHAAIGTDVTIPPATLACVLDAVYQYVAAGVIESMTQASDIAIAHAVPKFTGALRLAGNGHGD